MEIIKNNFLPMLGNYILKYFEQKYINYQFDCIILVSINSVKKWRLLSFSKKGPLALLFCYCFWFLFVFLLFLETNIIWNGTNKNSKWMSSNKDNCQHTFLVVFQCFNWWLDACMTYKYRISRDIGAIWIVWECSREWHFTAIYFPHIATESEHIWYWQCKAWDKVSE